MFIVFQKYIACIERRVFAEYNSWVKRIFCFILVVLFGVYWKCTSYFGISGNFWTETGDPNYLSLGHALNIDFWLFGNEPRDIGNSEIVHPGIPYQIVCWLAYRLSSPNIALSPAELVNFVFRDPSWLWPTLQIIPFVMTLLAMVLIWRLSIANGMIVAFTALAVLMVNSPSFRYPVWLLFNESFAPLLAVIFFSTAFWALSLNTQHSVFAALILGLAGALVYSQKLTYICWDVAVVFAFMSAAVVRAITWRQSLLRIGIFLMTLVLAFLLVCWLFLGVSGLKLMFSNQLMYFTATGTQAGPKSVISLEALIGGILKLWQDEPAMTLIIVVLLVGFLNLCVRNFRNRAWQQQYLPQGVLVMASLVLTALGVLKIYVHYYIIAISVVFPFAVIWFARAGGKRIIVTILPIALYGLGAAAATQYVSRQTEAVRADQIAQDRIEILQRPLEPGRLRLWMYLFPVPEMTRQLLLQFSSLHNLEKIIYDFQGAEYISSPWHNGIQLNNTYRDISETNWQYQVVDEETLSYIEKNDKHPWLHDPSLKRTEFSQLVLFERP